MDPQYNPKETEDKIYNFWEEGGYFKPCQQESGKAKKTVKNYSVAIPPPNITGSLHMGHALNNTIQDILVRSKRMQGYNTVWVPGIDHAGISMQNVVEKELRKQDLSRYALGREKFLEKCWEWKEQYGNLILSQIKTLGCSCDWSRTRFTMDDNYTLAVQTAFKDYYDKKLVYRGKRVINWCPRCATSISDLEVEHEEEKGKLWFIKYPLNKNNTEFITVATTRPETMLGDVAVAVNPKDKRYKDLVGKKAILPLVGREIPIIADDLIDKEFGTGAVKVTPAHDLTDYAIGNRHKLEMVEAIGPDGKMTKNVPPAYQGFKITQAREKILEDLKNLDLLEKTEDYTHQVPHCERCHAAIELLPSEQWFLKMKGLAKKAADAVRNKKVKFHPKNWEKTYLAWLDNIQDWCLSRQLWWGHQMPVWECQTTHEWFAFIGKPENCPKCKKCAPVQSQDVFDTWFSSALWPFAIFGWPEKTEDFKNFYPTNTLSTARDIINLWVARMVYSGMEFTGKLPFKDVIIHATILNKEGKRMSKSLGTGVDPLVLINQYGTDATRMGLIWQVVDQQDVKFSEDAIIAGKKFCNKLWNASRFVMLGLNEGQIVDISSRPKAITPEDKQILSQFDLISTSTTQSIEKYEFGKAIRELYEFFWHEYCDIYIEKSKAQLQDEKQKENTQKILLYVLTNTLALFHPFIPFVTEAIYQLLPIAPKSKALIIHNWPMPDKKYGTKRK